MTTRRGLVRAAVALTLVAAGLAVTTIAADAAPQPPYHPSRLAHVGEAEQVVVVTSPSWSSTVGTVRAYERIADGSWREVVGATPANLGWSGMVLGGDRRQGTGKTPAGTYALTSAFGRKANPGTKLLYRKVDRDDAWTYDPDHPATYNMLQIAPVSWRSYGGYVEHLWSYGLQYDYVAVIGFNLPPGRITMGKDGIRRTSQPADTSAGGGIFLHVSNGKNTAGCVAIAKPQMREILAWLNPAKNPTIVIGPLSVIDEM